MTDDRTVRSVAITTPRSSNKDPFGCDSSPLVTVLLPVRNGEAVLGTAITSILTQTLTDFEILILDDGSTDSTCSIAEGFGDERLRVVSHSRRGLPATLNRGIELARGTYIARMDADDVSESDRLRVQVEMMSRDPSQVACGVWARTFGYVRETWRYPSEAAGAKARLLFRTPIVHPSAMMRRDVLIDHHLRYDESLMHAAEDWDLWLRLSKYGQIRNVPRVHFKYHVRRPDGQSHNSGKWGDAKAVARRALEEFGLKPTEDDVELHLQVGLAHSVPDFESLGRAERWLLKLATWNQEVVWCPRDAMMRELAEIWLLNCRSVASKGHNVFGAFRRSPLGDSLDRPALSSLGVAKSLLLSYLRRFRSPRG